MPETSNDLGGFESDLPEFSAPSEFSATAVIAEVVDETGASSGVDALPLGVLETKGVVASSAATTRLDLEGDSSSINQGAFWSGLWVAVPSWLISTFVHVAIILVLAAWNIEPIQRELKLLLVSGESTSEADALEEFGMDEAAPVQVADSNEDSPSESPVVDPSLAETIVDVNYSDVVSANMPSMSMPSMTEGLIPKNGLASLTSTTLRTGLNSRSNETKRELLRKFGGTTETERAVSMALKWLAEHQDRQTGAWTLSHSLVCKGQCDHPGERRNSLNAATGLALMCFLGAGQTHLEGDYKETVLKGLGFLIKNMKFQKGEGSWYIGDGFKGSDDMYSHGIATIAMSEAYGMTHDPALRDAAIAGVNFLATAQNPTTGGWHYAPKGLGDTSVVGWQMMALKSAAMSGLPVNLDVVRKANMFLDQMAFDDGASYHYDFRTKAEQRGYNPSTTACAVLCRMYSGMPKDHPSVQAAVAKFSAAGPSKSSTYYNYYATQVLKQYGGKEWESWNVRMRDQLLATQSTTGHSAGSWFWEDGHSSKSAGRHYTTCMATMMLEVYYRYMPLYAEQTPDEAFKL